MSLVSVAQPARVRGETMSGNEELSRELIIKLTNAERENTGLTRLIENPVLDYIAEARARDIIETQFPSHVSPSGQAVSHVARRFGYPYTFLAENLASGNSDQTPISSCTGCRAPNTGKTYFQPVIRAIGISVVKGRLNGKEMRVSVQVVGSRMRDRRIAHQIGHRVRHKIQSFSKVAASPSEKGKSVPTASA